MQVLPLGWCRRKSLSGFSVALYRRSALLCGAYRAGHGIGVAQADLTTSAVFTRRPTTNSGVEASAQLLKREHHSRPISGPRLKVLIPGLDIRYGRPLNIKLEITIKRSSRGDIGETDSVSTQIRTV